MLTAYTIKDMRSLFFKSKGKNFAVKLFIRLMAIIFALFWGMVAFGLLGGAFEKNYLYPLKYKDVIIECSNYYGLDSAFIFAVVKVESGFDKYAVSTKGAVGLMQITPRTAEYIAKLLKTEDYELNDEYTNVWFGCFYYKYLLDKFKNLNTAICAYNAGEGNVLLWLSNKEYSNDGVTLFSIPFKETQEYLRKIDKSYKKYSQLYGNILDKHKNFE